MAAVIDEHEQFVGTGGKPVVNGYLYFGIVDTDPVLNPKDIFSDRELTTALANPQRTDSTGRAVNKIWIDGKYSFQLNDSNDVQLYQSLDNGDETLIGSTVLGNVQGGNAITATASPTATAYTDKQQYLFTIAQINTGDITLNIDNLGAKSVVKNGLMEILPGEFKPEAVAVVVYNASLDHFDWVNQSQPVFGYSEEGSGFTVLASNRGFVFDCTATLTAAIDPASALDSGFVFTIKANGGDVTVDPNGFDTINGDATLLVRNGTSATIVCDGANFHTISTSGQRVGRNPQAGNYTVLSSDRSQTVEFTATATAALTAAATLGEGWFCYIKANGGAVTIDPNGSETIDGSTTLVIGNGSSALILCDGSNFFTSIRGSSGGPSAVLEDQKSQNTSGGTIGSANTWVTHDLNTEVYDPGNVVTLSSDQFTVASDGWVEWICTFNDNTAQSQSRLFDVTGGSAVGNGLSVDANSDNSTTNVNVPSSGGGPVIAGRTYRIEVNSSDSGTLLGRASNRGTEVYMRVQYWGA